MDEKIQKCVQAELDLPVELLVVEIGFFPFLRKRYQHYPAVLLAPAPFHVALFHKAVDR